jgi:hypothetical protein
VAPAPFVLVLLKALGRLFHAPRGSGPSEVHSRQKILNHFGAKAVYTAEDAIADVPTPGSLRGPFLIDIGAHARPRPQRHQEDRNRSIGQHAMVSDPADHLTFAGDWR